jgi:chromosomal replication initiation ATPase DnaA
METERIAAVVASELGMPAQDILSLTKKRGKVCYARAVCMYLCSAISPYLTHGEIATQFGVGRTSVCRAIKKVDSYCSIYSSDRRMITDIRTRLEKTA